MKVALLSLVGVFLLVGSSYAGYGYSGVNHSRFNTVQCFNNRCFITPRLNQFRHSQFHNIYSNNGYLTRNRRLVRNFSGLRYLNNNKVLLLNRFLPGHSRILYDSNGYCRDIRGNKLYFNGLEVIYRNGSLVFHNINNGRFYNVDRFGRLIVRRNSFLRNNYSNRGIILNSGRTLY